MEIAEFMNDRQMVQTEKEILKAMAVLEKAKEQKEKAEMLCVLACATFLVAVSIAVTVICLYLSKM